jgi:predicted MFS family arabinose efflux permease
MSGNVVSLIGLWLQRLAVGWLAWDLTKSGFWVGAVAFGDLFPVVILGPFGGVLADRIDRRIVIFACHILVLIEAGALCALTAFGVINIGWLFAMTLFRGSVVGVHQPARLALVPALVRKEDVATAFAINSVTFNLARFVGPAIAGLVITRYGIPHAFAANAFTYLVMIIALLCLRLPKQEFTENAGKNVFGQIADGIRYAANHPAIGPLLLMLVAIAFLTRPILELLPGFAGAVFERGPGGLAILTSAAGLGAVVGGLWLALRGRLEGLVEITAVSLALAGLCVAAFASTANFNLGVIALTVAAFAMVVAGIATQTLLQVMVDDSMRGRVLSFWGLILRGGPAVGAIAMGGMSEFVGFGPPLAFGGALCFLGGVLAFKRRTRLASLVRGQRETP